MLDPFHFFYHPETEPASDEEAERRRTHVRVALADSRIAGCPPPSRAEQAILDAYIRGEIEARDLVDIYKKGSPHNLFKIVR